MVVVLPLVPVTTSHGVSWSGSRSRQASSTSPQTGMPRSRACASSGELGPPARRGDQDVDVVGQRRGAAGAEPDGRAEHLEQLGLLGLLVPLGRLVERGDRRPEVGQVVGGGEPGDAEPGDDRADAVPGVVPAEVERGGHSRATHSA